MTQPATLLRSDEALRFIEQIADPITKSLVKMAFVHFVRTVHLAKQDTSTADFDMLLLARTLAEFFAEHEVLARTLEGEKVGAWFEEKV